MAGVSTIGFGKGERCFCPHPHAGTVSQKQAGTGRDGGAAEPPRHVPLRFLPVSISHALGHAELLCEGSGMDILVQW